MASSFAIFGYLFLRLPQRNPTSFLSSANCFESGGDVTGSSETSGSLPLYRHSSLTLIVKESGFVKPLFDFSKSIVITTARAWASAVNFALEAAQISIIFRPPHEIAEKEFFYKSSSANVTELRKLLYFVRSHSNPNKWSSDMNAHWLFDLVRRDPPSR